MGVEAASAVRTFEPGLRSRVTDRHPFHAEPDSDPGFEIYADADPDPNPGVFLKKSVFFK